MTARRVLVTGAGGFVGRALSTGFADLGWSVVGVDRSFDEAWRDGRIERIDLDLDVDLDSAGELLSALPEAEVVVHAAWITTDPETLGVSSEEYEQKNLRPLEVMLRHAARTGPAAFVFLSSSGVFGPEDGDAGLTDADPPTGNSPYARAKLRAEARVLDAAVDTTGDGAADHAAEATTSRFVVRLGYLFGPGEAARSTRPGVSLVARWLESAHRGLPLEVRADDPRREWTFAPDLAAALERVLASGGVRHPIHLGSPNVLRDREVAELIATEVAGASFVTVPARGPVKPPMTPSDLPELRGFDWTGVRKGLHAMATRGVRPTSDTHTLLADSATGRSA